MEIKFKEIKFKEIKFKEITFKEIKFKFPFKIFYLYESITMRIGQNINL